MLYELYKGFAQCKVESFMRKEKQKTLFKKRKDASFIPNHLGMFKTFFFEKEMFKT
jgi:hypothetical protein